MNYVCTRCGQIHEGLPSAAFDRPAFAHDVPEDERSARVLLTEDLCVVDDEHFFIRGVIEIPIHDYPDSLVIGAWVSQKKENYEAYVQNASSADIGPFFGWLSNELSFGGEPTLLLKTMVHFRGESLRPQILLEPTDHPLARAQSDGITLSQAWDFLHPYIDRAAT